MHQQEDNQQEEHLIDIEYYSDPLCCWSWAFEPQWRRLRYEFAGKLRWRYHMGGLLASWGNFSDPLFSVNRPQHMGPVWMEAQEISGQPLQSRIWVDDPPASSYPACIAVKCAGLQSAEAEEAYLRRLREAVMMEGKNISKKSVLMELAEEVIAHTPKLLDLEQFRQAYVSRSGEQPFREDLQKVRFGSISRFPTLILKSKATTPIMITGYRPYEVLLEALQQVASLKAVQHAPTAEAYKQFWGGATEREVTEALKPQKDGILDQM